MLTFLYWNIDHRPLANVVANLAIHNDADVIILAESDINDSELLIPLNTRQSNPYTVPLNLSERLSFFIRFPPETMQITDDLPGLAIRRLLPPGREDILIAAVHLGSKIWESDVEQDSEAERLAQAITERERLVGHTRTVVIGDLNMHPFQDGLTKARAFHSVMDRRIALTETRSIKKQEYRFFYNPMWSHFGDCDDKPPGTYYRSDSSHVCHYWCMFDQILIRPVLIPLFDPANLGILTSDGTQNLAAPDGTPSTSDHFPIKFSLNI